MGLLPSAGIDLIICFYHASVPGGDCNCASPLNKNPCSLEQITANNRQAANSTPRFTCDIVARVLLPVPTANNEARVSLLAVLFCTSSSNYSLREHKDVAREKSKIEEQSYHVRARKTPVWF